MKQARKGTLLAKYSTALAICCSCISCTQPLFIQGYTVNYIGVNQTTGTAPIDTNQYRNGAGIKVASQGSLQRHDYYFSSWNTREDNTGITLLPGQTYSILGSNLYLYSQWSEKTRYSVLYDKNAIDGSWNPPVDINRYTEDDTASVLWPDSSTRGIYFFSGWSTIATTPDTQPPIVYSQGSALPVLTSDVTLYAYWTSQPTYSVAYDWNGGSDGPIDTARYNSGQEVVVSSIIPTRHGWAFDGWSLSVDNGLTWSDANPLLSFIMGTSNVILRAKWSPRASFSVTYYANGGSGEAPIDTGIYYKGDPVIVKSSETIYKVDHTFLEWTTQLDAGTAYAAGSVLVIENQSITLYAHWRDDRPTLRSEGTTPTEEIGIYVNGGIGATFAPQVVLESGGTAQWYFSGYGGGTAASASSTSPTPSISYTGTMLATLKVSPSWSALKGINLGYNAGDGGTLAAPYMLRDQQNVTAVSHLNLAKDALEVWCSSGNARLTSLSFDDFAMLTTIECYFAWNEYGGLVSISLANTPSLARLCVEHNSLVSLDLRGCPNLVDLRGADNKYPGIAFAPLMPSLSHLCIRSNNFSSFSMPALSTFPSLRDFLFWSNSLKGTFTLGASNAKINYLQGEGNAYNELNFSGADFEDRDCIINFNGNDLASVNLTGVKNLKQLLLAHNQLVDLSDVGISAMANNILKCLDLSDNYLTSAAIDGVLGYMAESSTVENGIINISGGGNSPLSAAAHIHRETLVGRGWTVTVND
jgi:uncharacterized repeat protein (TIGR02543 family)